MIKKVINSGVFAILVGLLIFAAQERWQYSNQIKLLLILIFTLILGYLAYELVKLIRLFIIYSKYDVIVDIADHQLVISSDGIVAKIYYLLTNRSRNVVRIINYDYDGGNLQDTIFPRYIIHNRSKLSTGNIAPIGGENGIVLLPIHEYGENKQIYYAEWGLELNEPLQPNESISYSRHYKKPINEKIDIDEVNEFSFRMRLPSRRFLLALYCDDLYFNSQEVYITNQSGKKLKNINFKALPFSLKFEIKRLKPNERVVVRFVPKNV